MKLRTLNCKNCDAPLRQEGEKLVCQFCGSTFDIPKDANDIAYEQIINAEDYIRLSLAKSLLGLEKKYSDQALMNQANRDRDLQMRRARMTNMLKRTAIYMVIALMVALFFTVLTLKLSDNRRQSKKPVVEEVTWNPGYRITPSDLKADKEFGKLLDGGLIEEERQGYDDHGAIIFGSDDIWNISKDPEILGKYLVTEEDRNTLYIVYKITFEKGDGTIKEMYDCQAYEKITIDEDGNIVYDRKEGKNTDDYDFRFHADPELEPIMETYINPNKAVSSKYMFEF